MTLLRLGSLLLLLALALASPASGQAVRGQPDSVSPAIVTSITRYHAMRAAGATLPDSMAIRTSRVAPDGATAWTR